MYLKTVRNKEAGQESAKEYRRFKNKKKSVVIMTVVDSKYCFIWANCNFAGNYHDSTIFQTSQLYR